jgi:Flp pilus assembly protein TadD
VEDLVSPVDLLPTVLDLFGWNSPGRVSGRSFAGLLEGKQIPEKGVCLETQFPLTEYGWSPLKGLIKPEWKYIAAPEEELYQIRDDPGEKKNLAASKPEKLKELKGELAAIEGKMVKKKAAPVKLDSSSRKALESLGYMGGGESRKKEAASLRNPAEAIWMRREFIRIVEDCRAGRLAGAEGKLKALIRESPESYAFHYKLAKILYDQGRFREALGEFKEMARMNPEEYRTHYNLGKTLLKLGRYPEAIRELRAALKLDPEQTPGYNNLGIAYLKTGRIKDAMAAFRKSIAIDPEQVDPLNNLGNAFLSLGKTGEAMKEFRKAVKAGPDFFEGRYNLGLTLLRLGRYEEAAREFRAAVRLRPDFAEARRQLNLALRRAGMN